MIKKSFALLLITALCFGVFLPSNYVKAEEANINGMKIVTPEGPVYQSLLKGTYTNLIPGDFNGDGLEDFIRQEKNGWDNDNSMTFQLYMSAGNGSYNVITPEGNGYQEDLKGTYTNLITGDYNGDGKTDFIRQEKNGLDNDDSDTFKLYISRGDGQFNIITPVGHIYQSGLKGTYTNLIPGDFNGDGKTDFLRQEKGAWSQDNINTLVVYLSLGDGNFETISQSGFDFQDITGGEAVNLIPGDFNGDGYCDFIRQEKNGWDNDDVRTVDIYFSNGNGTFWIYTPSGEQYYNGLKGTYTNLIPGDYDGDGKTDIGVQEKNGWDDDSVGTFKVYFSKGEGEFFVETPNLGWYGEVLKGTYTDIYAADVNGDGKDEILRQEKTGYDNDDSFTFNVYFMNLENKGAIAEAYEIGNRVKAIYTKPTVNLASGKSVKASTELTLTGEVASKAVDGVLYSLFSKWCTDYGNGKNQWIEIDLGRHYYVDRWVVTHSKWYNQLMFTKKFRLQYKNESGQWVNADSVVNNSQGQTDRTLSRQFIARYVRVYVDQGDYDNCVRIHEIELYNSRGYVPAPGDILLTEESTPDHAGLFHSGITTIEAQSEGVTTRKISKWYNYGSFKVMRTKDASYQLAEAVAAYAYSKIGYPYNFDFSDYKDTGSFYCTSLVYRSYRSNGVKTINLDSDVWTPPLTVSDIMDDNDTYTVYDN